MKPLLLALCALLLIACEANAPIDGDVNLSASAILARQTSDAASARSSALSAQATAARQATTDTQARVATDAAITLQFLRVTEQARQRLVEGANLQKTEVARFEQTRAAETKTASALARLDAETAAARTFTASVIQTGTRRAEERETATATAAVPTQRALARIAEEAQAERERRRMLELERYRKEMELAPYVRAFELFMPYCVLLLLLSGLTLLLWRIGEGVKNWLDGKTLQSGTAALAGVKLITDAAGNPLGYLSPVGGVVQFQPLWFPKDADPDPPPVAALLVSGGSSRTPDLPPVEPLVGELIHLSDLKSFVETILADGDWTQDRWANVRLPRGYTLSMDTVDAGGNKVPGGYSQLLQMLVDAHLIIGRKAKATGRWNPRAPTEPDRVLAILTHDAPPPALPAEGVKSTPPLPYPNGRRGRKVTA